MKIEVLVSQWSAEGEVFAGGVHEVEKPSKKFLGLAALAELAGSLIIAASKEERAIMRGSLQSQADGEKALAAAQADGSWQEANRAQFDLEVQQGTRKADL